MKEELVSFQVAKLAKEKGFNELCLFIVDENNSYDLLGELNSSHNSYITNEFNLTAPTQSLLQKWLREEHKIYVDVLSNLISGNKINFTVRYYDLKNFKIVIVGNYSNYEEALEEGLYQALKLIK